MPWPVRCSLVAGPGFQDLSGSAVRPTLRTILRLNKEHLETLTNNDPTHKPPAGFWVWQGTLRILRAVLGWQSAQKKRPSPWPDRRALKIRTPAARELPVELQTLERRRLIEGLKAINSRTARACKFICYTGFRRREGTALTRVHLVAESVLEFQSKTRTLRVPLSRQALALIDSKSDGRLLHVGEDQLRKPLIRRTAGAENPPLVPPPSTPKVQLAAEALTSIDRSKSRAACSGVGAVIICSGDLDRHGCAWRCRVPNAMRGMPNKRDGIDRRRHRAACH